MASTITGKDPRDTPTAPPLSTRHGKPLPDGRVPGVDGSVWLWRKVPLGAMRDVRSADEKARLGGRIDAALNGLAGLARQRGVNRQMVKSSYRRFKLLSLNVPAWYEAPTGLSTKAMLDEQFENELVPQRLVMFGVKLLADSGFHGIGTIVEDVTTFFTTIDGAPMEDFERDAKRVTRELARAELAIPDADDFLFAGNWWNHSMDRASARAVPTLAHVDHQHFLRSPSLRRAVDRRLIETEERDCDQWPPELVNHPDMATITFGAIEGFDYDFDDSNSISAAWGVDLLDAGTRAISVEGIVEPAKITKTEVRRQRRQMSGDRKEFAHAGKETGVEMQDKEERTDDLYTMYSKPGAPPTLVDTSILVALDGRVDDIDLLAPPSVRIDPMTNLQGAAWQEMMICSSVRANPHLLDLPSWTVSYAGTSSIQAVSDSPLTSDGRSVGALAGFTEDDHQPAYLSSDPQTSGDNLPIRLFAASPGSGKLLTLDTLLPTPDGGRIALRDVRVGTGLLGRDGNPCMVTALSEIEAEPELFRVTLDDGQHFDACADHQWIVTAPAEVLPRFADLEDIVETIRSLYDSIPTTSPMTPEATFSLFQRVFGERCPWPTLQMMHRSAALLNRDLDQLHDRAILAVLATRLQHLQDAIATIEPGELVLTTGEMLELAPAADWRIRASTATPDAIARLDALTGLHVSALDSDKEASITVPAGAAPELLDAARRAGHVATLASSAMTSTVSWTARAMHHGIASITPIDSRPGRCITVDSPDSSYLIGDYVPTHNTMLLLWLAHQWYRQGSPQLILDPKPESDHSKFIRREGGKSISFSDLEGSDGILDPLRFSTNLGSGITLAADMITRMAPWGVGRGEEFQTDVLDAIRHGVAQGARATGQALRIAERDGIIDLSITAPIHKLAASSSMFRTTFGYGNSEDMLDFAAGMTYFYVGSGSFELPAMADTEPAERHASQSVRASANAIRMLSRAGTVGLARKGGVLHFDEGWVLDKLAPGELEAQGRLARELGVLIQVYTQTPSGPVENKTAKYVGSGAMGYVEDPDEAVAAMRMMKFRDPLDQRVLDRLVAPRNDAGQADGINRQSLQTLFKKDSREVVRGSVFYLSDATRRLAPVEVILPKSFLKQVSTNSNDRRERDAAEAAAQVLSHSPA